MDARIEARIPTIVYGFMVTFIVVSYVTDMIINTNRQATHLFIFRKMAGKLLTVLIMRLTGA